MEKRKKQKSKKLRVISDILTVLIILTGAVFLGYPTFSQWWNSMHMSRVVANYDNSVDEMSKANKKALREQASEYNKRLIQKADRFNFSAEDEKEYNSVLDVNDGVMAVLDIPKIDVKLPVYHGTGESVLQMGIGHLEGSSFPVGGKGTHAVLSGHRGLPNAELLSGLDRIELGDYFTIRVLGETLTYKVDNIETVLPDDLHLLEIDKDKDLCTIVTCTPYGINTHRLMIRGERVPNPQKAIPRGKGNSDRFPMWIVILIIAFLLILIIVFIRKRSKSKSGKQNGELIKNQSSD
ncbi:MAG: class C sortase [Oscillospiraceae bacterium]